MYGSWWIWHHRTWADCICSLHFACNFFWLPDHLRWLLLRGAARSVQICHSVARVLSACLLEVVLASLTWLEMRNPKDVLLRLCAGYPFAHDDCGSHQQEGALPVSYAAEQMVLATAVGCVQISARKIEAS